MNRSGTSRTIPLEEGANFVTKQMEATGGRKLPRHQASTESVLVVIEGACSVEFSEADHSLKSGESLIIPKDAWHQISADPDFKAVHIMPKDIRFKFSS